MATAKAKIFGIGLSKTGTTSLANALQVLGFKVKDNMGVVNYATGDLSSVDLDLVEAHDALTDTPIPSFYRALDARYPGSKFILTVRDSEGWLNSCKKQFTQRFAELQTEAHKRLFIDLYDTDVFDDRRFVGGYQRFVDGVREYFKGRPRDLLIMDIAAGEGWEKLCPFLERPVPDLLFPKANVTQVRWMSVDDVIAVARQAGLELMQHYDGDDQLHSAGMAKKLVARVVRTVLGEDAVQAAVRAAHKVIVTGLTKLNPHIPVLSRAGILAPHAERKGWNHLWLVDPLDGEGAFAGARGDFSVNIALIEDGRPIYGVVHAPSTGATYYASMGKSAYRCVEGEKPVCLAPAGDAKLPTTEVVAKPGTRMSPEHGTTVSSHALAICAVAEKKGNGATIFPPGMEWHVAAAHAILNAVGMCARECESVSELSYNKKNLSNRQFKVE